MDRFPFRDVVVIADERPKGSEKPIHLRHDLEMGDERAIKDVLEALGSLGLRVHRYHDPLAFAMEAANHHGNVVFPLYGGERSRNRMALIPAICEIHNLRYVGPDVYGSIICQDKEVSKNLARECGLVIPWHRIIRSTVQIESIAAMPPPFVVKPLLEGSSIGITQENLVRDVQVGARIAADLLGEFKQPVMIEEFIAGREVSYNCIQHQSGYHRAYSEILVAGDERYFDTHLFDAAEKLDRKLPRSVHVIDSLLEEKDVALLDKFLSALGPSGYCRVDGKHLDGRFVFIEMTPDAWIGKIGAFAASFLNKGWSYEDVIKSILLSAVQGPHDRSASG